MNENALKERDKNLNLEEREQKRIENTQMILEKLHESEQRKAKLEVELNYLINYRWIS